MPAGLCHPLQSRCSQCSLGGSPEAGEHLLSQGSSKKSLFFLFRSGIPQLAVFPAIGWLCAPFLPLPGRLGEEPLCTQEKGEPSSCSLGPHGVLNSSLSLGCSPASKPGAYLFQLLVLHACHFKCICSLTVFILFHFF